MNHQMEGAAARLRALAADIRATASNRPAVEGSGRGLVVVAGGARIFTNAYVLLHVIRNVLKSLLPVELWYFGQTEISPAMAALIEPYGVRLIDANPLIAATGANVRDGWQLKCFALVHSHFAEALLLDADQVPVTDPSACFDWPQYVETGAVFWPDVVDVRQENAIWPLLGLAPRRAVSFESGQLLVDRRRHAAPLAAALRLNEAADDVYQLIYGDKDTYLLAWEMLKARYALVPHRPYNDEFMLVQRDFDGNALFQHRTNAKWQYGGQQRKLFAFRHENACLDALAELEHRWSGHAFTAPDRTGEARKLEEQLIAAGSFRLEAAHEPGFAICLRPHAEVGEGRAADRRHWWVEQDDDAKFSLVLSGGDQRNYVLQRGPDHIWRGTRHRLPAVDISLIPRDGSEAAFRPVSPGLVDELLRASGILAGHGDVPQRLMDALTLLAQVVPGVRERLMHLARMESDPGIGRCLQALALGVGQLPSPRDVDRRPKLETGYVRAVITE